MTLRHLCSILAVLGGLSVHASQLPVFRASGRFLRDPCGDTIVIRGIEMPVNYREYIPEVAKTGANFIRVLVNIPPAPHPVTYAEIDSILALSKRHKMGVDISVNDLTKDGSSFTRNEVMAVLKKYEDILCLHAQGEGTQETVAQWLADAKGAITRIRNAGYRCPLFILSNQYGRNPYPVLQHGREVFDHDPEKNTLLGVQLYWGYTDAGDQGWWLRQYKMTDAQALDTFALKSFPIVAGINNHDPYGDPWLDYETQLAQTQKNRISWFWWDWYNPWDGSGKYHLSTTGKYGDWGVVAAGAPDLDKITISGGGSTVTIEAENYSSIAGVGWGKISHGSVSGGQFLCCSGKRIPDWAEWQIDGGTGGQRTVTIRYSNGSRAPQSLKAVLNGDTIGTFTCGHSGDGANEANFWRVWKDESLTLTMRAGTNTLRLVSVRTAGIFNPHYGYQTIIGHPASVKNTSVKGRYLQNFSCGATAVGPQSVSAGLPRRNIETMSGNWTVTDARGRIVLKMDAASGSEVRQRMAVLPQGVKVVKLTTGDTQDPGGLIVRFR